MTIWVTSDLHLGHKNIIKFCPITRGRFTDEAHMTAEIVKEWNEKVQPGDLVYILGDVAFMNAAKAASVLDSMNGDKILIEGNHDQKAVENASFRSAFKEIHKYLEIKHNGHLICMFHYPIFDHNQAGRGSIMLHGHRHGNPHNLPGRIMDVGFDATGNLVTNLDDIVEKLTKVDPMHHH
jgi:calcineurin-like phosphoesterase family protein